MDLRLNNVSVLKNTILNDVEDVNCYIESNLGFLKTEYYLIQNGKKLTSTNFHQTSNIHICLRLDGGKGGFGSMLRAIGAQIEKTTNREACRDLSGRRLRDINEEARVKTWLEKQKEREDDTEDKKKKKLEKMLIKPKHEFKDELYEQARTELTQQIDEAVEQGFKKVEAGASGLKRKTLNEDVQKKKKKGSLWIGADDLSSSSDTDSDSSTSSTSSKSTEQKTQSNTNSLDESSVDK